MTTTPAPFATTPPPGLPELIEHDACALAAFATRDGKPSHDVIERALLGLDMMVHRAGSVDGEGDGSGLQVDIPRPLWAGRLVAEGLDAALAVLFVAVTLVVVVSSAREWLLVLRGRKPALARETPFVETLYAN